MKKTAKKSETNTCMSLILDKNTKEAFLKKLKLCMQNFDYKDETKDVKGKVSLERNSIHEYFLFRLTVFKQSMNCSNSSKTRKTLSA